MAQDRENYCFLIGVNPYKEADYSEAELGRQIDKKASKWTKDSNDNQNSLSRRFKMSQLVLLVPDIRTVMKNPQLRAGEFDEGRKLLRAKASKLRKDAIILQDGSALLIQNAENDQAKRLKWDNVDGATLLRASGLTIAKPPVPIPKDVQIAYEKFADVGVYTPAELLNTLIQIPELEIHTNTLTERSGPDQIRTAFGVVESRINTVRNGMIPNQDAYITSIRSLKMVLDSDKLSKLTAYGRCMRALAPAKDTMDEDAGQPFTSNYIDSLLAIYARGDDLDTNLCVAILEDYCYRKRYLANFSRNDSRLTICPTCKAMIEDGDDNIFCPVCGGAVKIVCPRCNMHQFATNQVCVKCGFDFRDGLENARKTEAAVRAKLAAGNIKEASDLAIALRRDFPSYPKLDELRRQVEAVGGRYQKAVGRLADDYKVRNMYDFKRTTEELQEQFPDLLKDDTLKNRYKEACDKVGEADRLCGEAVRMKGPEAMDLYVRAADRCPDHPEAVAKLKDYPPEAPADATIQVRYDTVVIRFAVPEDRRSMTFCIFRSKGTLPTIDQTTVPLAEIPGGVYQDRTLDPGADYYYKIYTRRWGIMSHDCASCGPAIVFREVDSATLTPIDDGLRIEYQAPRGCSRVRIWRKDSAEAAGTGDEVEVQHDNTGTVNDRGLRGGVKYHYLFVAEYDVNGRTERSLGVEYAAETVRYPDPVRDMEIRWNKSDGSYTARWSSSEQVVLYSSPKRVKMFGQTVPMDDLESWMTKIEPLDLYKDGCRFELPDGAVRFVYPMIPVGRTAIRGRESMITNLRPFRDVEKRLSNNECDLSMTWPEGADTAMAVIGDRAMNAGDPRAEKITVSREGYNTDRHIRINMGQAVKKTVTLYAVYDIEGTKMKSLGVSIDLYSGVCTKVRYTVKADRPTRKDCTVQLAIDAPEQIQLPQMVMVAVGTGIPLKITDGETVWSSGGSVPLTGGKTVLTFTVPRERGDVRRMRLFFPNKEDYNLNRFIHPLYAEEE